MEPSQEKMTIRPTRSNSSPLRGWRAWVVMFALSCLVALIAGLAVAFARDISTLFYGDDYLASQVRLVWIGIMLMAIMSIVLILMQIYLRHGTINLLHTPFELLMWDDNLTSGNHESLDASDVDIDDLNEGNLPEFNAADFRSDHLTSRLSSEIESQNRKANINLGLGTAGAILALILIGVSIYAPPNSRDHSVFWATVMSRGFLSLTASIFAFFFLSTYRRNLSEIRYFHNELTNVESKLLSIEILKDATLVKADRGDGALLHMLQGLSATERNFILRRGESTTDLHQKDMDRQEQIAWASALASAFSTNAPSASKPNSK